MGRNIFVPLFFAPMSTKHTHTSPIISCLQHSHLTFSVSSRWAGLSHSVRQSGVRYERTAQRKKNLHLLGAGAILEDMNTTELDTISLANLYNLLRHTKGIPCTIENVDGIDTLITRFGSITTETTIDSFVVKNDAMSTIDTVVAREAEILAYDISYTLAQTIKYLSDIHEYGYISPVSRSAVILM